MISDSIVQQKNSRDTPKRFSFKEGIELLKSASLNDLKEKANQVRNYYNNPELATYVIDTNPNYTNVCTALCSFCAFQRLPGSSQSYLHDLEGVMTILSNARDQGVTTVLLQGGLHPDLELSYYTGLVCEARKRFPEITPHFFSAPEIQNIADVNGLSVYDVLSALWEAGQRTLPGGGAEILTDRVRNLISPKKINTARWMEVHEVAHEIGFRSTATMMYGHLENDEDIVEHLHILRDLQDKYKGFTAFIPWSYKPINKKTVNDKRPVTPEMYYRILAFSRIYLDNFAHVQASWFSEGKEVGIESLSYGADDFGGTLFDENVHKAAKFVNKTNLEGIKSMIQEAGFTPTQRDTLYNHI